MSTGHRKPITRTRELLACTECRRRKLKCDHNEPCSSCARRGDEASCTYERFARGVASERERRKRAESRLEHLEGLVQQLAALQGASSASDPPSQTSADPGSQEPSTASELPPSTSNGLTYTGSTHWSAMLEDIEELRTAIGPADFDLTNIAPQVGVNDDIDVLFGAAPTMTYDQILDLFLPSRQDADRLIAAYFRASSIAAPFIHASVFRKRYEQFWADPRLASPLWASIFFTICHIADSAIVVTPHQQQNRYNLASAHCLACGRYYKPQPHAVESLLLFTQSKLFIRYDITSDYAMLMAAAVRSATTSGYHRDPSLFQIPAFEQEMRRRTWSMCLQLDLLISFALGLPSNVQFPTWDTQRPRNLIDTEFDESSAELPPPRPDSELTNIIFYNAKHTVMAVFEKILRHSLSTDQASMSDVETLNSELDNSYYSLPEILRPLPIRDAIFDSPSLVVTRLCVLFLYGKCRCVLHRKHAARGDVRSIGICYDASTTVLRYYIDIFNDFQPGGQFESERWLNSTITWQDFLLAIMVLCLVLFVTRQTQSSVVIDHAASLDLLKAARAACDTVSPRSKSTERVTRLVDATIASFDSGGVIAVPNQTMNGVRGHAEQGEPNSGSPGSQDMQEQIWKPGLPGEDNIANWGGENPMSMTIDDDSWAYLEQFLNIPGTI